MNQQQVSIMIETYKELYTICKEVNLYVLMWESIQMREQIN